MKELKHVAVAGNIGSGKTTLTALLARHYGWEPHYEEVEGNPYISDFYEDMQRWSFHMQVYYLNKRFHQVLNIRRGEKSVIQDRTIYEDASIFAPNLHQMGLMSTRDFETYQDLFRTISELIQPPDLVIYLKASIPALVTQIQKRGRAYEDSIRLDYLKRLNGRYEDWIKDYKGNVMVVNVDETNFEDDPEALGRIIARIDTQRAGLF